MTTTFLVLFGTLVLVSNFICGSTFDILHEHLHNVDKPDLDKLDIAQTGQPTEELCQFWGPFGAIQITDQSLISSNWSLIEFKLKLRTNETIFSVELHNTTEPKGYFQPKPTFTITPQMHFKSMETFGSFYYNQIAYDAILHQVNISIGPPQVAFAVWDIKVDHKTRITKRQVTLNYHWELPGASSIASTYLVKSSQIGQAYIKYTFDDLENSSSNREYCFQLARTSHPQMVIEVYANLFGVNQFKKLYTYSVTKLSDIFCLSSSIYLRKLGRFDISFVFNGRVTGEDGMLIHFIGIRIPSNTLPSTRMSPNFENANWESLHTVWWYNNPRLFGHTIVSNASRMPWYACDIISNCYRYERKGKFVIETSETQWDDNYNEVQIKHSQTVWNYTLPQVAKQLLSHSPLIRVYNDDQNAIIFRETHYLSASKSALSRIEVHPGAVSPQLQFNPLDKTYNLRVSKQTRIPLTIPIELIDARAQQIYITIKSVSEQHKIQLVTVSLNDDMLENIKIVYRENYLVLSTVDYIHQASWSLWTSHEVNSFGIEFEVVDRQSDDDYDANTNGNSLVDVQIEFAIESSFGDVRELSIAHSQSFGLWTDNSWDKFRWEGMLDSKLNPTVFILNKWLQSTPGLTLSSVQDGVHLQLKTRDGTKLTSSSIQVNRIVIRSQKPFFTVTPMTILMDSNSTSSIVVVDLKNADNDAVHIDGLFRVGYMVELKETLKDIILMYRANFEKITQFGNENCHKGPTYADLDCHKHVYQCPDYYFSYDPIAKTCTRNDAPRHQ